VESRVERLSRLAVVDVGSNTVHLLVAETDGTRLTPLDDESARLRLGADVVQQGRITPQKISETVGVLGQYVARAKQLGARKTLLLGTQAVRAAQNGDELAARIKDTTRLTLDIISPQLEARLGYLGTTLDCPASGMELVADIGGASTQMLFVDQHGVEHGSCSAAVGSVVLPTRFIRHDPPTAEERQALEQEVEDRLREAQPARGFTPESAVLIGGVARRLRRAARLSAGAPLVRAFVERLAKVACEVSADAMEVLQACRYEDADMIRSGAIILREVLRLTGMEYCQVSDNGIREGAILALMRGERI